MDTAALPEPAPPSAQPGVPTRRAPEPSRAELSRPAALPPGRGSAEMNVPATPAPHAAVLHTKGACRKPGSASDPAAPAGFSRCDPLAGVPPAPPGRAEPTGPAPPPLTAPRLCYRGCVPRPGPAAQPSGRLIAPQGSERHHRVRDSTAEPAWRAGRRRKDIK